MGVVVRTEKRVVRARFSYEEKKFMDELIVLDLDDKLDMVLGMPWLARHDPVIDWAKRTIVRFRSSGATESDGPVGAAHAPRGACDPPAEAAQCATVSDLSARKLTTERVVREKCEPNQKTQIRSDLRGSRSVKGDEVVSTVVDTQVEQEWPVTEGSDLGASAPGADAIGPNIKGRSAVRRRGKRGASAPGADAASSAGAVTEGADALSAKSKKERFDEQSWDSLKSSPLYEVLREYKDVLPDDIPAELPQDKGVQHEIDLVPGTNGIPVLGCLVGKNGVRPDPGKIRVTNEWPTPSNVKELRQFLELATYVSNYAGKIRPLSQLLKKDAAWDWTAASQQAFEAVQQGLTEALILAVADQDRPFHVVCDASDFAIGCTLMQHDHEGRDHVVDYQSRQLKPAKRNYPVHDKKPLAMKPTPNAIGVVRTSTPSSSLLDDVRSAYANDADAKQLLNYFAAPSDKSRQKLAKHLRAHVHRYRVHNGLLLNSAVDDNADRVVVPDDPELELRITYEYHDAPTSGHPGREKTYLLLTRDFYWGH
ncbi:unnamed protein product [Phytophthora fragariaefolia]|uniref:Unnamed protein product n=1 Tax=Phytophthora fragariaefolia TaxID=1490495 RepID=A0A9W7D492_9STRA|nr:unnamed protein product [Phytophthora fragariaefolia]